MSFSPHIGNFLSYTSMLGFWLAGSLKQVVEIVLYILVGVLFGAAIPTLFLRSKAENKSEETRFQAMDQLYRELLKKRQSSDFRYSADVRKVIDRVHAENMLK